jgi:hypothetical protein
MIPPDPLPAAPTAQMFDADVPHALQMSFVVPLATLVQALPS